MTELRMIPLEWVDGSILRTATAVKSRSAIQMYTKGRDGRSSSTARLGEIGGLSDAGALALRRLITELYG